MNWAEYVLEQKAQVYPLNVIFICISIAYGVIGAIVSFLILLTVWKMNPLKAHIDLKLAFVMMVLDFNSAIGVLVMGIICLTPNPFIATVKPLCALMIVTLLVTYHTSIYLVSILSLERYLLIVHNRKLPDMFYWALLISLILANGVLAITEVGLDMLDIDRVYYLCMFKPNKNAGLTAYGIMLVVGSCAIATSIFCYTSIAIKVRRNTLREVEELGLDRDKALRDSRKTIIKSFILGTFILVDYFPQLLSYFMTLLTHDWPHLYLNFFALVFILGYVIVDPLILLVINDEINKNFKELMASFKKRFFS